MKMAFIGAGNMGGAIVRGVCKALDPGEVVIYRPNTRAAEQLAGETGCAVAAGGGEAVRGAKYIMLCVKPQELRPVLEGLLPAMRQGADEGAKQVVVSIAAGITIAAIKEVLASGGLDLPVVRVMPNTPSAIGEGILLMAPDEMVSGEDYAGLEGALAPCGLPERVTERELDLGTAISGCGPAFAYLFIEALADGGVQIGLPRDKAQTWAARMVAGAAEMVLRSGRHPGALKDAVCSPGGATIAGVAELEKRGFRAAAAQAVVSAWEKGARLGE